MRRYILIFIAFISLSIIVTRYFFPQTFEKIVSPFVCLYWNYENSNKAEFKNIKKYGISLNFPQYRWCYEFHKVKDGIVIFIGSEPMIFSKGFKKNISIEIFKDKRSKRYLTSLLENNCKSKKMIINNKNYKIYYLCKEESTYLEYDMVYVIPKHNNVSILFIHIDIGKLQKNIKNILDYIKLE